MQWPLFSLLYEAVDNNFKWAKIKMGGGVGIGEDVETKALPWFNSQF